MLFTPLEIASFAGASLALALAPGPDLIFVLSLSMTQGRRAGAIATLGLCSGLVIHIGAVAGGLAALIRTSPTAFSTLKWIGAAYLLSLAWRSWRAGAAAFGEAPAPATAGAIYRRAIAMNVSNPKVAMFFLAFLPPFVHPERGAPLLQIILLGGLFMLCALICLLGVAALAAPLGRWLRAAPRREAALHRFAALVFVGLAARLALD